MPGGGQGMKEAGRGSLRAGVPSRRGRNGSLRAGVPSRRGRNSETTTVVEHFRSVGVRVSSSRRPSQSRDRRARFPLRRGCMVSAMMLFSWKKPMLFMWWCAARVRPQRSPAQAGLPFSTGVSPRLPRNCCSVLGCGLGALIHTSWFCQLSSATAQRRVPPLGRNSFPFTLRFIRSSAVLESREKEKVSSS